MTSERFRSPPARRPPVLCHCLLLTFLFCSSFVLCLSLKYFHSGTVDCASHLSLYTLQYNYLIFFHLAFPFFDFV